MHADNRILIRLTEKDLRSMHKILRALIEHRGHACLLDLRPHDVDAARNLLERIPNIVPQTQTV